MTRNPTKSTAIRRSDEIYEQIAASIHDGTFQSGTKLPPETVLAAQYSVSRPTLREALARLREDGLVRSRQGSGVFVQSAPAPPKRITPLTDIGDLKKCFEYRIGLETEATRIAATQRNDGDLAHLRALYACMDRMNEVGQTGMDEDYAFHLAVAKSSGNRFFVAGLEQVRPHIAQGMTINRTLSLESAGDRQSLVQAEHGHIIACLERRNAAAAAQAMTTHLKNALKRFMGEY